MQNKIIMPSADKAYLWLLSFYPEKYRKEYGEQMLYMFKDLYREQIELYGTINFMFWVTIVKDVIISSSAQHFETMKQKSLQEIALSLGNSVLIALFILLLLTPAIADLLYTSSQIFALLNMNLALFIWIMNNMPQILIAGIVISIILYLITIIHLLVVLFKIKQPLFVKLHNLYIRFKPYFVISNILSLSSFMMLIPLIIPFFVNVSGVFTQETGILFKSFFVIILTLSQMVKPSKLLQSIGLIWFALIAIFVGYLLFIIYQEFQPQYYGTFPLDDIKGVYKLNYDGDYWITYYDVKEQCTQINSIKQCNTSLIKKGNTSIVEAPGELDKYLDKSIIVTGEFVKIHGPGGDNKQFCIKSGITSKCRKSTGHGIWYFSPLKIKSIKLK